MQMFLRRWWVVPYNSLYSHPVFVARILERGVRVVFWSRSCLEISIADVATTVLNQASLFMSGDFGPYNRLPSRDPAKPGEQMHQKHRQERKLIFGTLVAGPVSPGFQAKLWRVPKLGRLSWFGRKWDHNCVFTIFDSFHFSFQRLSYYLTFLERLLETTQNCEMSL